MLKKNTSNNKTPRFSVLRVLFIGFVIYQFLNIITVSFSVFKEYPLAEIHKHPTEFKALIEKAAAIEGEPTEKQEEELNEAFEKFFNPRKGISPELREGIQFVLMLLSLISLAFITWYHFPLYKYFYKKRGGQEPPETLRRLCKRRLMRSALVVALTPLLSLGLLMGLLLLLAKFNIFQNEAVQTYVFASIPLSILSQLLACLLTFFLQKFRVQRLFLHHVFNEKELRRKLPGIRDLKIHSRLIFAGFMTTFLPLAFVLLFIFSSISTIEEPAKLTGGEISVLLGDYIGILDKMNARNTVIQWLQKDALKSIPLLLYFNAVNTPFLLIGIFLGVLVAVLYTFMITHIITYEIVAPLQLLQKQMKATAAGEMDNFALVRNNDEIGDLTVGFNRMLLGLQEREKVKSLFGQYLTREVSDEILKGRVNLEGERFDCTVMFADIRNFTTMSESMTPEEVVRFLNSYLECMIDVIVDSQGIIDKFIGDGILAVFGVPIQSQDHADQALQAALKMQGALTHLNTERAQAGETPIAIGIGLHTGVVIAGNIGNAKKLEYTIIGDTVNLASRIEGLTKKFKSSVLMSENTFARLSDEFKAKHPVRELSVTAIRGKTNQVRLFTSDP